MSCLVLEKRAEAGGVAGSFDLDGFTFDCGIHGLYRKDEAVEKLLTASPGVKDQVVPVQVVDFWESRVIPHPIQSHLAHLPLPMRGACLLDFLAARIFPTECNSERFSDWATSKLGRTIATEFAIPYADKFWATPANQLGHDWVGARVRIPSVRELTSGAIWREPLLVHYVKRVRYPLAGGFGHYTKELARDIPLNFGEEVVQVDHSDRTLHLSTGERITYRYLVSTLPLPALCPLLKHCPDVVRSAAQDLRATTLVLLSLGLKGPPRPAFHWGYSFDKGCPFSRVSMPHAWAESNAPQGGWSVQAELYCNDANGVGEWDQLGSWLKKFGMDIGRSDVVVRDRRCIYPANVIYDHRRTPALRTITDHLDEIGILRCGRYAEWNYALVDDAVRSAWRVANDLERRGPSSSNR